VTGGPDPVRLERRAATFKGPGLVGALLVLACFYLLGLIVQMPMRVLVGLVPLPPEVRLAGQDDSAWVGTVESVIVAGQDLGSLDYLVSPWRVLLGEIQYAVALDTGEGRIETTVNRSLWTGTVTLGDLRGEVNATVFHDLLPVAEVIRGQVSVALDSIVWRRGEHFHAEGRGSWRSLVLGPGEGVLFGNLDFELRPQDAGTLVEFASRDGEVLAAGTVFLDTAGGFESSIEISAGNALTPAGRSLLNLVRSVDDDGILKHAGKLF
jgi:hypothetical protein